jgi:hypothetical protein
MPTQEQEVKTRYGDLRLSRGEDGKVHLTLDAEPLHGDQRHVWLRATVGGGEPPHARMHMEDHTGGRPAPTPARNFDGATVENATKAWQQGAALTPEIADNIAASLYRQSLTNYPVLRNHLHMGVPYLPEPGARLPAPQRPAIDPHALVQRDELGGPRTEMLHTEHGDIRVGATSLRLEVKQEDGGKQILSLSNLETAPSLKEGNVSWSGSHVWNDAVTKFNPEKLDALVKDFKAAKADGTITDQEAGTLAKDLMELAPSSGGSKAAEPSKGNGR